MNFKFYVEKLKTSKNYREFIKENPKTYFCSGFFVIDKEGEDNQQHFDFYIPEKNKIFSFKLEKNCEKVEVEILDKSISLEIPLNLNFDFNEIEKLIFEKKEEQKINNKIQKILLSLQKLEDKFYLVGTIFISMLGMIKICIDLNEMKIMDFEKKSMFDILKVKKKED